MSNSNQLTAQNEPVAFDDRDTRPDAMHETVEQWLADLREATDEAAASEQFQTWLDAQRRFHDYSMQNTLLIRLQRPDATRVAGYRTWQTEFDRQVRKGESAIWIWAPIVARQCPKCGNAPSYHGESDCEYEASAPETWSKGVVGFRPVAVFDVSQTEGEPLPELETAVYGEADDLVSAALAAAETLGVSAELVATEEWSYGDAKGVCKHRNGELQPHVAVRADLDSAIAAHVLAHEYAHARLHVGRETDDERAAREVEAESVAYIVSRHFGLDASNASFYLAAWRDDETDELQDRLERIRTTAMTIISEIETNLERT
ncbi:DUF955 domain-containing protein [halophilic archaeon]|nr:DUF955 domain-containing protein [halophilic archaeon]